MRYSNLILLLLLSLSWCLFEQYPIIGSTVLLSKKSDFFEDTNTLTIWDSATLPMIREKEVTEGEFLSTDWSKYSFDLDNWKVEDYP